MEIFLDDIKTDSIGGFDKVQPGSYHLLVTFLDEEGGVKGETVVDFEILRGTTPNQEGKVQREYFSKDQKPLPRRKFLALAIACGLITKEQLDAHKANGTNPLIDFNQCVNKQCCANFEANEYEGKVSTRLKFDEIFYPSDKRANHIPLNMGMLTRAGITLPPNRHPDGILHNGNVDGTAGSVKTGKPKGSGPVSSSATASNVDDLLGDVQF